jgi:asparagine synthase (glutamine-hydrolysing)
MCGIAGIVSFGPGIFPDKATVHRMCQTIVHRGPDDEGTYVRGGAALGMRRLSIIDLAGGHQPIHNEDETVWVVFNGEIYNFPELRAELERRGHRFYTSSDTEVIVHLYEDLGSDCVRRLRGMFAFALYDERSQRLLLARDRLGIKPLHYAIHAGQLFFGSEIKAILAAAPELAEINPEAVLDYFYCGYIPDPFTAFRKIHKLPPGHILELEKGESHVRSYWDLPAFGTHNPKSEEECLDELSSRLFEAVRVRLISDVPLGALLSGGTDSSIVVAMMARASRDPVKTFSIGFEKDDFNEAKYARLVAQKFGTEHHELIFAPDLAKELDYLTHTMEEPFGDSSMLPTYYVSRLARQHVTVALSGDGGDELFAGYERYRIHQSFRLSEGIPKWMGKMFRERIYPQLPYGTYGRQFLYNLSLSSSERYLDSISFRPTLDGQANLLSNDFRRSVDNLWDPLDVFRKHLKNADCNDALSRLLYLDIKTYLPGDILTKVDRMSMLTSLEVRVPILDHLFVEWVTGLSANWKWQGKTQKYILKKLAAREGVPNEVIYRRKQGFALPLVHWIRNELKEDFVRILLEPRTLQRGYFDAHSIQLLLAEHFRGRRNHAGRLWRLLAFELWQRNYVEGLHSANTDGSTVLAHSGEKNSSSRTCGIQT